MTRDDAKRMFGFPPYDKPNQETPPPDKEKTLYELSIYGLTDKDRGLKKD